MSNGPQMVNERARILIGAADAWSLDIHYWDCRRLADLT
jgi:hypothetical protein